MKRKAGRIISIILSLILLSGLLPEGLTIRVYAEEPSGDPENGIELNGTTNQWTDNVYVNKNAELRISNRVKVSGDVILILEKDTVLNCADGIHVPEGSSLTIEGEGKLIATSENFLISRAGIGGNNGENCGSITINGGIIEATGNQNGAGIGGGKNGSGGTIIINKGEITARGGLYAAGIGGGNGYAAGIGGGNGGSAGTIEINGGSVMAIGGYDAAGIGCGKCGSGGTITVNDGTVTASGGSWGAGIGSGETDDDSGKVSVIINNGMITAHGGNDGAGIGSGALKEGGNGNGYGYEVLIYGGTVIATGGSYGAGIGSGGGQIVTSSIKIYGGKIKATGGSDEGVSNAAGIGAGNGGTGENILLSWSDPEEDYIESDSYAGNISFGEYTRFKLQDSGELATTENIGGKRIIPFLGDLHSITTNCSEGGSVRTDSDKSSAGQKVNISWNVEYPYDFKSVAVTAGESNVSTERTGEGSASFIMPDRDVEVSVVFERISAVSRQTSEGTKSCDPVLPQKNEYSSGWYTINRDVSISNRISIIGDVKLFLTEGMTLSCLDGITVAEGNSLTIEGTGKLIATDNYVNAAIGGLRDGSTGSIIIKSGIVEATANHMAAGIGGGYNGGSGNIVIEGGTVKAVGGTYTGAIGCGNNGSGGSIQISGGKVSAIGGTAGIGIGGDNVTVKLGWTEVEDEIYANAYSGNVSFISGKYFKLKETDEAATIENIGGSCIVPNSSDAHDITIVAAPYGSIRYLAGGGNHQDVLDKAPAGAKLFVSYECVYPYEFTGISVTDNSGGNSVTITKVSDYVYSFIMPDHPIKLTALYTETKPVEMMTSEGLKACVPVRPCYTDWDKEEWYVLTEDVTFADDNITVKGDIKLLLMENATLTIHGHIDVKKDNSLTIEGKGSLTVDASGRDHVPGIGGGGNIIIRGGNITSKGGFCAAGIGGEHSVIGSGLSGNSGNITIEGGTVTAVGGYNAAGIGSNFRELCGDICISGGIVTATGGCKGAGIGGGYYAPSGNISISGGTVTANGGLDAAGIGGGFANMYTGYDQPGGEILISGGKVTATGGGSDAMGSDSEGYGAGIGGGAYGNCREITITGGQVTAVGNARTDWSSAPYQQVHSAGIGNGWKGTADGDIVLGWTNEEDYIDSTSFGGNISFAEGKEFYLADGVTAASPENIISGTKLAPAVSRSIVIADGKRSYTKICGDAGFYLEGISSVPAGADFTFSVTDSRNISGKNVADDRIITVSSDGRVTIHGAGSAKIAVSASGAATAYIEVSIQKGEDPAKIQMQAVVRRGGNTIALSENIRGAIGTVSYEILEDDAGSCSVDPGSGVFTSGDACGKCKVKLTIADSDDYNGKQAVIEVTVTEKNLGELRVIQNGCTYGEELPQAVCMIAGKTEVITGGTYSYAGKKRSGEVYGPSENKPSDAGTYTLSVIYEDGTTLYSGVSADFDIEAAEIGNAVVTLGAELIYTGSEQTQDVSKVELGSKDITDQCLITDNKAENAGSYSLTVTARDDGNYRGAVTVAFVIAKKAVTPAVTVNGSYSYTGSAITPTVTVKESDEANAQVLAQNDYSVAATDNVHAGRGTLTISAGANGNYSFDAVTKEFEIGKGTSEAPTGITTVAETMMGKADGEICGLSTKMEYAYSADGDTWPSVYTGCPGTVLRNAKAGKYRIRYKENSDLLASEYAAVIVEAGESAEIKIEIRGKEGEITVTAKDVAGKTYDLSNGITKEDSEEKYTMANLPYGFYNITVQHTVETVTKTSTVLVETTERSVTRNLLVLKPGDNESVVATTELTDLSEAGVGSVLVGGLEDEAKGLTDGSGQKARDNKITIEIKSGGTETIASNDAEKDEKQAIVDSAVEVYGNAVTKAAFLEINVKQTQENGVLVKDLPQLNKVLELLIPYDFSGRYDVRLWRSHTGEAAKQLTALASKPTGSFVDGTYYIDRAHGRIFVYGSRYSVYALTYTTDKCFEVSFDPAGGSPVAKQSVKENGLVRKPADPT
ncbi:MAG: hypothetical protein K6E50_01555, partial [Lachnospiraceae bacterium]|nr:hypothetical protein [Lachnospiraceae bacterium]